MSVFDLFWLLLNFFFLDRDPKRCAKYHGDKHLNKMQLEYAQIASTVMHLWDEEHPFLSSETRGIIYKPTHRHHPIVVWASKSQLHVQAIIEVGLALAVEKVERAHVAKQLGKKWKTTHKSTPVLNWIRDNMPKTEKEQMWVDPPACMPACLQNKGVDVVDCYRLYYTGHKIRITGLSWRPYAQEPWFLEDCRQRLSCMQDVQENMEEEEKKQK